MKQQCKELPLFAEVLYHCTMGVDMEDSYSLIWEMKWVHKKQNINSICTARELSKTYQRMLYSISSLPWIFCLHVQSLLLLFSLYILVPSTVNTVLLIVLMKLSGEKFKVGKHGSCFGVEVILSISIETQISNMHSL